MSRNNRMSSSIINLRMFHNWVKNEMYRDVAEKIRDGGVDEINILELAVGKGGDLYKWIGIDAKEVIGIDIDYKSIFGKNGAIHRYNKMKNRSKYDSSVKLPKCYFHVIDLSQRDSIEKVKNAVKSKKFNLISCQFAIHYFFKSEETFDTIATIISDHIENGGYFMGSTLDGDKIKALFKDSDEIIKKLYHFKNRTDLSKKKSYGNAYQVSLGLRTDKENHYFAENDSIEYMVDTKEMIKIFDKFGLENIKMKEFKKWYDQYEKNKPKYLMTTEEKEFSFINFSFIFEKQ